MAISPAVLQKKPSFQLTQRKAVCQQQIPLHFFGYLTYYNNEIREFLFRSGGRYEQKDSCRS